MKSFIKEFREFALKGNVMDLAVGMIIGGAFTAIITAFIDDIINPIIGLLFQMDLSQVVIHMGSVDLGIGNFISAVINFLIIALVLFFIMKAANKAAEMTKKKEEEAAAAAPAEPSEEVKLLTEIRDALAKK